MVIVCPKLEGLGFRVNLARLKVQGLQVVPHHVTGVPLRILSGICKKGNTKQDTWNTAYHVFPQCSSGVEVCQKHGPGLTGLELEV